MDMDPIEPNDPEPHCQHLLGHDVAGSIPFHAPGAFSAPRDAAGPSEVGGSAVCSPTFNLGLVGENSSTLHTQEIGRALSTNNKQETAQNLFGDDYRGIRDCGIKPFGGRDTIELREDKSTKAMSVSGVRSCQTKICPFCSRREATKATAQVTTAIELCLTNGGTVLFLTLTIPHYNGDRLVRAREDLGKTLTTFQTKAWQGLKGRGLEWIKKLEVNLSPTHGWNPHLHYLLLLEQKCRPAEITAIEETLAKEWVAAYQKASKRPFVPQHMLDRGVHLRGVSGEDALGTASYMAKSAMEDSNVVHAAFGQPGDTQTYTPGDLLTLAGQGDQRAADLLREYSVAMRGVQRIRWSNGFLEKLGIVDKADKHRVAKTDANRPAIATIKVPEWCRMVRLGLAPGLKRALAYGRHWVLSYLDLHGIDYDLDGAAKDKRQECGPGGDRDGPLPRDG